MRGFEGNSQQPCRRLCLQFVEPVDVRTMSLDEVREGVRRAVVFQDATLPSRSSDFISEAQASDLAAALLRDANLLGSAMAAAPGLGRVTITPQSLHERSYDMLFPVRAWMYGQALVGKLLLNACGIKSCALTTSHGVYHYYDSCPDKPHASPIVMLHGMFTTAVSMGLLGALLARKRRVVIPDMLDFDFSWSASHHGEGLSWVGHVDAIAEFIRAVGHDNVDVIGHSYGGWMAARLSRDHPELIHRMVLIAPGGLGRYRSLASARLLSCRYGA